MDEAQSRELDGRFPPILNHRVKKDGNEKGCWLWLEGTSTSGYARARLEGKQWPSLHRYVYREVHGRLPFPETRHRCDVRHCLRPSHLIEGTRQENAQDRVSRNRSIHGAKHGRAKIDEQKVTQIWNLIHQNTPLAAIGRMFGVDRTVVSQIKRGLIWRHVKTPDYSGQTQTAGLGCCQ
jgi:hypothetical protein